MSAESCEYAIITPITLDIESTGQQILTSTVEATSQKTAEEAVEAYKNLVGGISVKLEKASSSFGFNSKKNGMVAIGNQRDLKIILI